MTKWNVRLRDGFELEIAATSFTSDTDGEGLVFYQEADLIAWIPLTEVIWVLASSEGTK